ncbi:MAG: hypothetical protein ACYTG5_19275 [Planctomycetota bacterium]|jgi:hypothetical protein
MDRVIHSKLLTIFLVASILLVGLPLGAAMPCMGSDASLDCCCSPEPAPAEPAGCCDEEDAQPGSPAMPGNCACIDFELQQAPNSGSSDKRSGLESVAQDRSLRHQPSPRLRFIRELPDPKARSGPPLYLLGEVFLI